VLAIQKSVLGPEHPDTPSIASNLAIALFHQRKQTEAQPLFEATLDMQRRVLVSGRPILPVTRSNTASLFDQMRSQLPTACRRSGSYFGVPQAYFSTCILIAVHHDGKSEAF
jgi:hypothetical protein